MKSKYTVDYFISKFNAIPANCWTKYNYINILGQRCVHGFCGKTGIADTPESTALYDLFFFKLETHPAFVNDGTCPHARLLGSTPKERILNALELIKAGVSV